MSKALYRFYWDCGRMGDVEGVFVADTTAIKEALGKEIYLGEALGKHSEVFGPLEDKDVTLLTEDQAFIAQFETFLPRGSGYNPLNYTPENR